MLLCRFKDSVATRGCRCKILLSAAKFNIYQPGWSFLAVDFGASLNELCMNLQLSALAWAVPVKHGVKTPLKTQMRSSQLKGRFPFRPRPLLSTSESPNTPTNWIFRKSIRGSRRHLGGMRCKSAITESQQLVLPRCRTA